MIMIEIIEMQWMISATSLKVFFLKITAYLCFNANKYQHIKKGND